MGIMGRVGALFTVNPPTESAATDLPWIVTIGPLDDADDWEPVLCGPYERPHALALARAVVAHDELMAVVEPVQPYVSVGQIRAGIEESRAMVAAMGEREDLIFGETPEAAMAAAVMSHEEIPPTEVDLAGDIGADEVSGSVGEEVPAPDQIREGFMRVAKRLISTEILP